MWGSILGVPCSRKVPHNFSYAISSIVEAPAQCTAALFEGAGVATRGCNGDEPAWVYPGPPNMSACWTHLTATCLGCGCKV